MAVAGGRARCPLVVQVRRAVSVTSKDGRKTCDGLSVTQRKRATGAGHNAEPGLWREYVAGSERMGAVWSQLEDAGQLFVWHAECGLLGSSKGGNHGDLEDMW